MDKPNTNTRDLIKRYLEQSCTEKEQELVEDWYESLPNFSETIGEAEMERDLRVVHHRLRPQRHHKWPADVWRRVAAAAVIVLIVGTGAYYYLANRTAALFEKHVVTHDMDPGSYKATLTLDGGQKISLKEADTGRLAMIDGVQISKAADGQLVYEVKASGNASVNNRIEVPRGGEYQVVLPDGSHVWLNAGSSLKYPTRFTGASRRVELTGEAYFEVSAQSSVLGKQQAKQPFVVVTAHQQIEVLGTRFNVSAYADDPATKTTLLEGKIRVITGQGNRQRKEILYPGQLATLTSEGLQIAKTDAEAATAWQRGYITGYNMTFDELMKQLSRWYDFEYEGTYNVDALYSFSLQRTTKLSMILQTIKHMESGDFTFQIENKSWKGERKVYVKKNDRQHGEK